MHIGTLADLGLKPAGFKAKNCPVLVLVLVAVLVSNQILIEYLIFLMEHAALMSRRV
jgi:hypothetical protein